MHVLLPPSETKRSGGGGVLAAAELVHHGSLGPTRTLVREALESLSADEEAAANALKLGVKSRGELQRNRELTTSGVLPAIERYTGVLFDSLDVHTLEGAARSWVSGHVSIQSALFGLVSADDAIPAYRLSASTRLPQLGAALRSAWEAAHAAIDWAEYGWLLDMRSKGYAALAPLPPGRGAFVNVAQRGADGEVRALNHFNKAAKGALLRRLAQSQAEIDSRDDFIDWAEAEQLEVIISAERDALTLVAQSPGAVPSNIASAGTGSPVAGR